MQQAFMEFCQSVIEYLTVQILTYIWSPSHISDVFQSHFSPFFRGEKRKFLCLPASPPFPPAMRNATAHNLFIFYLSCTTEFLCQQHLKLRKLWFQQKQSELDWQSMNHKHPQGSRGRKIQLGTFLECRFMGLNCWAMIQRKTDKSLDETT